MRDGGSVSVATTIETVTASGDTSIALHDTAVQQRSCLAGQISLFFP
jgi:hypothetical protein